MWSLLAMYIPFPERAVGPAFIQLVLIALLAGALYVYLRPRCGRAATVGSLIIGELMSFLPPALKMLVGLGEYGDHCRASGANYSDWVLILTEHFDLYGFAINSVICLLLSALTLFSVKTLVCACTDGADQHERGGNAESSPGASSTGDMED